MLKILDLHTRHLACQILIATAMVTVIFLIVALLWSALPLLSNLSHGMGLGVFAWLIVLAMPRLLPVLVPLAACLAVIFVYHRAAQDGELVVMRATGLSNWRLARPAVAVALVLTALNFWMSFQLAPIAFKVFKEAQFLERYDLAALTIQPGKFRSLRTDTMVYVRERSENQTLYGILLHDTRNPKKSQTWMAEFGQLIQTPDGPRLILRNGNLQEVERETGRMNILSFSVYTLDLSGLAHKVSERWRQPEERSTAELFWLTEADIPAHQVTHFRAEGHYRVVSALFAGAVIIVSVAVMLVGPFGRRRQVWRAGLAFGASAVLLLGAFLLRSVLQREPSMAGAIYLLVLGPPLVASATIWWSDR